MGCSPSSPKSHGQDKSTKGGEQAAVAPETGNIEPQAPAAAHVEVQTRIGITGLGDSDAKYNGQRGIVTKDLGGGRYEVCLEETKDTTTLPGASLVTVAKDSGTGAGAFVMLCQLHTHASWNGLLGCVESEEVSVDQVNVRSISDGKLLRVRPANLVAVEADCNRFADQGGEFHRGAKVLLHSLSKMPELNGVAARVGAYDREAQLYHVFMDNGNVHQVKAKYLRKDDRPKELVEQPLAPSVPASNQWKPGGDVGEGGIINLTSQYDLKAVV